MPTLSLTQKDTALSFQLDDYLIQRARLDPESPGTGTEIIYGDPQNTGFNKIVTVTETPAQVAAQSEYLIPLTVSTDQENYTSVYLNSSNNHFGLITSDGSTGSIFTYFMNDDVPGTYYATESPSQIRTLLEQEENEDKAPVSVTKTAQSNPTLTAAEMGAGLLIVTGTTGTVTLPTATALASQLGAVEGSSFIWKVNSTATGNTTINTAAGGWTQGTWWANIINTNRAAEFKILFQSTTAAMIVRSV